MRKISSQNIIVGYNGLERLTGMGGPGGPFNTGQPGPLRLLTGALRNEMSGLLPFGLFAIVLLIFQNRQRTLPIRSLDTR